MEKPVVLDTHRTCSDLYRARCPSHQSRQVPDPHSRTYGHYHSAIVLGRVKSYSPVEEHSSGVEFVHQLQKRVFRVGILLCVGPYRGC
jgi:hypothetical protein